MIDVTEPERVVAGLGKHPAFVRRENVAVIIVDQRAKASAGRAAQVNIANGAVREHPREKQRRVELPERGALPVDLQNPAQSALVEGKPLLRVVLRELLCLDGKTKRRKGPQEDAVQPELQIFIDDFIDAIEARFRGGHQGPDPVGT